MRLVNIDADNGNLVLKLNSVWFINVRCYNLLQCLKAVSQEN